MAAIRKETADQFRVSFGELARAKRGEPVQVDPFLIAQAIAHVMRECTVRSAAGRTLLWNEYRVILARKDFDLVRSLQGPLEHDLQTVLAQEAKAKAADLVGELRITVVFDEADELVSGDGVVRVSFVPTERLAQPRSGEMTVRLDSWAVAGEIAARAAKAPTDTMFVDDSSEVGAQRCVLQWPGGDARLEIGATTLVGRPHPDAPSNFIALEGASSKINKQQFWIALGTSTVRIGRFANANPVHVNGQPLAPAQEIESALPAEVSLSRGDLVLTVRRR
jgi:hypothetical protein